MQLPQSKEETYTYSYVYIMHIIFCINDLYVHKYMYVSYKWN